jgi:hypothetical protein
MQPVRWQCNRVRAEFKTLASADFGAFDGTYARLVDKQVPFPVQWFWMHEALAY